MPVYVSTPGSAMSYCTVQIMASENAVRDIRFILLDYSPLIQPSCWCFERVTGVDHWLMHFVGLMDDFDRIFSTLKRRELLHSQ
jgi:hypothetical protein